MLPAVEHTGERSLEEELDIQEQIRERVNEEELRNGKCESSLGEVRKKKDNKQTNSNNSLAYVHDWLWCKAADLGRRGGHNDRERVIDLLRAEALTCDVKGEFGRGQSMFPAGPTLAHTVKLQGAERKPISSFVEPLKKRPLSSIMPNQSPESEVLSGYNSVYVPAAKYSDLQPLINPGQIQIKH
jgi:hypothetical protein